MWRAAARFLRESRYRAARSGFMWPDGKLVGQGAGSRDQRGPRGGFDKKRGVEAAHGHRDGDDMRQPGIAADNEAWGNS